jgi:hypothetical protein
MRSGSNVVLSSPAATLQVVASASSAFGSEEWRTMDAATCLGKLTAAQPSAPGGARPGQHERLGEMFKDGVLDVTIALGFDEDGANKRGLWNLVYALLANRFLFNPWSAAGLYQLDQPSAELRGWAIERLAGRGSDTARARLSGHLPRETVPALRARITAALQPPKP